MAWEITSIVYLTFLNISNAHLSRNYFEFIFLIKNELLANIEKPTKKVGKGLIPPPI